MFRPHIAPPTMTLEEFGRLEMEDAIARQSREQQQALEQQQQGGGGAETSTRWGGCLSVCFVFISSHSLLWPLSLL